MVGQDPLGDGSELLVIDGTRGGGGVIIKSV